MKVLNLAYPDKSDIKFKIINYPDGQKDIVIEKEGLFRINLEGSIVPEIVQVSSRLNNAEDLLMIVCVTKALKRMGMKTINLYVPYIMGARSDRQFVKGGNSYLVDIIAPILNSLEFESITCLDIHNYDVSSAVIKNLIIHNNSDLVLWSLRNIVGSQKEDINEQKFVMIAPDAGAQKKIYNVCKDIGFTGEILCCSKVRDSSGKIIKLEINGEIDNINRYIDEFSKCVVIDDISDGGATFIKVSEEIVRWRKTPRINGLYLIVSHAIQEEGLLNLSKHYESIYTTNSYKEHDYHNIDKYPHSLLRDRVKQLNIF